MRSEVKELKSDEFEAMISRLSEVEMDQFIARILFERQLFRETLLMVAGRAQECGMRDLTEYIEDVLKVPVLSARAAPEKKVELTESGFSKAFAETLRDKGPNSPEFATSLQSRIFGGGDGRRY